MDEQREGGRMNTTKRGGVGVNRRSDGREDKGREGEMNEGWVGREGEMRGKGT